jgi:glucokinase
MRRCGGGGHRGLIAAGTGLGEALLIWDGKSAPADSVGGRALRLCGADGPRDCAAAVSAAHAEWAVSWERVVSGLGIKNVYAYLRDVEKMEEPAWLRERMAAEDPNAVIGECAEDGSSPLCFETMKTFAAAYGAEAGNIALKVLAVGGMYLGGGIAPKMLKTLGTNAADLCRRFWTRGGCRRCWSRFRCG